MSDSADSLLVSAPSSTPSLVFGAIKPDNRSPGIACLKPAWCQYPLLAFAAGGSRFLSNAITWVAKQWSQVSANHGLCQSNKNCYSAKIGCNTHRAVRTFRRTWFLTSAIVGGGRQPEAGKPKLCCSPTPSVVQFCASTRPCVYGRKRGKKTENNNWQKKRSCHKI